MSSIKTLNQYGLAADDEVTYGTFVVPTPASDGVLPAEQPEPAYDYLYDGARGRGPMGGQLSGVGVTGRGMTLQMLAHQLLPGAAYSAVLQPSLERLMRYCGFATTLDVTPGSESYILAPESAGFDSGSLHIWSMHELWAMAGAYGTFGIEADGPVIPMWTFDFQGIGNAIHTDVTPVPAIGYLNATKAPQKAVNIVLTIGAYAVGTVRGFEFSLNRDLSARANDNSAVTHAGFTPGNRAPRLTVTMERELTATFNPYSLMEAGTLQNTHLTIGSAQYSKWALAMATAEIMSVEKEEDGNTALWVIELEGKNSTPQLQDDVVFTFD